MDPTGHLQVVLTDTSPVVAGALRRALARWPASRVRVRRADLARVAADAVVAPGNSFGFMDGGVDLVLRQRFGAGVERRLHRAVADRVDGELVVGRALVVPTGDPTLPWLVYAPTMRVPMRLPVGTVNPYLAMRAALLAAAGMPVAPGGARPIGTLVVPGLGTGTGRVPADVAARQVVAAIHAVRGATAPPATWLQAVEQHRGLAGGRSRRPDRPVAPHPDLQMPTVEGR